MSQPPVPPPVQYPPHQETTHVAYHQTPTNGTGVAGFVLSLGGLLTCGILCPIGLVVSLIGLKNEPKGMAIAGSIIGGMGSLVGLVVVLLVIAPAFGLFAVVGAAQSMQIATETTAKQVTFVDPRLNEDGGSYEVVVVVHNKLNTPVHDAKILITHAEAINGRFEKFGEARVYFEPPLSPGEVRECQLPLMSTRDLNEVADHRQVRIVATEATGASGVLREAAGE